MTPRNRIAAVVLLAAAACATASGGKVPAPQVERGLPAESDLRRDERTAYAAAREREARGDEAAASAQEQARADWAAAAAAYAALAERPAASPWRAGLRERAAVLFLRAQRWDDAAGAAGALAGDAQASEPARAVGARLAATASLAAAVAAVKGGQLEKLELGADRKPDVRPPPAAWKRVAETTDAYLARADADPEAARPDLRDGPGPAELAVVAAEVQYAYGDVDDARRRLEAALERWPVEPEVLDQAVPLYLATYVARGDHAGHDAAVERLRDRIEGQARTASAPDRKAALAKALEALSRARTGARFAAAQELVAKGKPAEAARTFEALASDPGGADPANALHNAAVAWDRANEPARAAQVRERILKDHPDAKVAEDAGFRLAAYASKKREHLRAVRLYEEALRKWPSSPNRCLALQNVASELDLAAQPVEAAVRYLAFGRDEGCAKADPNVAARALVRAGRLFDAEAAASFGAATALQGVTDPEAKRQVDEARLRARAP